MNTHLSGQYKYIVNGGITLKNSLCKGSINIKKILVQGTASAKFEQAKSHYVLSIYGRQLAPTIYTEYIVRFCLLEPELAIF